MQPSGWHPLRTSAAGQLQRRLPEAAEAAERQPAAEQEVAAHARLTCDVEHQRYDLRRTAFSSQTGARDDLQPMTTAAAKCCSWTETAEIRTHCHEDPAARKRLCHLSTGITNTVTQSMMRCPSGLASRVGSGQSRNPAELHDACNAQEMLLGGWTACRRHPGPRHMPTPHTNACVAGRSPVHGAPLCAPALPHAAAGPARLRGQQAADAARQRARAAALAEREHQVNLLQHVAHLRAAPLASAPRRAAAPGARHCGCKRGRRAPLAAPARAGRHSRGALSRSAGAARSPRSASA